MASAKSTRGHRRTAVRILLVVFVITVCYIRIAQRVMVAPQARRTVGAGSGIRLGEDVNVRGQLSLIETKGSMMSTGAPTTVPTTLAPSAREEPSDSGTVCELEPVAARDPDDAALKDAVKVCVISKCAPEVTVCYKLACHGGIWTIYVRDARDDRLRFLG